MNSHESAWLFTTQAQKSLPAHSIGQTQPDLVVGDLDSISCGRHVSVWPCLKAATEASPEGSRVQVQVVHLEAPVN